MVARAQSSSARGRRSAHPPGARVVPLREVLSALTPARNPGVYVYCSLPASLEPAAVPAVAWVREAEGTTVILEESDARALGLAPHFRAAWITLTVQSALDLVGLTAEVAVALTEAGISCNVVAGLHHDHLFVPVEKADRALDVLARLSKNSRFP